MYTHNAAIVFYNALTEFLTFQTGATNTNRKKKRVVRFQWNAPPTGTGPIQFW